MKIRSLGVILAAWPALALAGVPLASLPQPEPQGLAPPGERPLPRPQIAPPAAWVEPLPIPAPPKGTEGAATIDLLGDLQVRFAATGDTTYSNAVWQVGTAQGLDNSTLNVDWDPALEVLTLHRYRILRDGKAIDLLGDGARLKVIQRETRMEDAMLDGRLTATLQPEDLRVGDVLELAYSITRHDPATAGRSDYIAGPADGATYGRFRVRMLWDKDKQMHWRAYPGVLQPRLRKTATGSELVADLTDMTAPLPPAGAPARYRMVNAIEISEFADWAAISRIFAPLYVDAVRLAPDSPVRAEAARIAAQTADPARRAELALKLVQEQVRYLFLGMDDGGFVPAPADQTWVRRFGDCKAKTVLLVALLKELGIAARPVLVHTRNGDLVAQRLPVMDAFDHAIVEATIGGRSYWLDSTRLGDERLDQLETPDYQVGLPLTEPGSGLVQILPEPFDRPSEQTTLTLDASKGLDVPATVNGEMRFHGTAASDMRLKYAGFGQADRARELRKLWRDTFDYLAPGKVGTHDDPETGDFILSMSGSAQMEWNRDQGTRWFEVDRSRLGWRLDIAREGELSPDAPFSFSYPDWTASREVVILPRGGKGFRVQGGSFDKTVGDLYQFRRTVKLEGAVVTMDSDTRAIARELPAARAARTRSEMAELSMGSVFIRVPDDYEPTDEEKALAIRQDAAEAAAHADGPKSRAAKGGR